VTVPVARKNLFAEKGRFTISVAGVAFAVMLILIVLALYRGFSESGQTFRELPGQLWVVQEGTVDPFHSVSLVRPEELDGLRDIDDVEAVFPVLSRLMEFSVDGSVANGRIVALDIDPSFPVPADDRRRFLPPEGTLVIDDVLSRKTGLRAGDSASFAGVQLVVDHVQPPSADAFNPFIFTNYSDAERIFGRGELVSYGVVVVSPDADFRRVAAMIDERSPGLTVFTQDEFAESIRREIDESFLPIIAVLVGIGFVVGAAVVGLTIYTATIERAREFGVMKAVGGSAGFLYRIVLSQSVMLSAAGFVVGLAVAWVVAELVREAVPDFVTIFQVRDIAAVFGATLLMAVIASFVPVRRINAIDPAMVFKA
jgi:putative ABC transport system permease protein